MLKSAWARNPERAWPASWRRAIDRIRERLSLVPYRWAILRSFTVEPVVPILRAMAYDRGIALDIHVGEFNAYAQEILDPESALYRFRPSGRARRADPRHRPDLWRGEATGDGVWSGSPVGSRAFRRHSAAALIVHSLETRRARGRNSG